MIDISLIPWILLLVIQYWLSVSVGVCVRVYILLCEMEFCMHVFIVRQLFHLIFLLNLIQI